MIIGQMLPYPKDQILSEVILLLLFGFVEASRIFWGKCVVLLPISYLYIESILQNIKF